ncbi:MAG: PQQ-dependent sugar dehydrogenase [Flavobacteriales bacterium]|nr:PQQ-dependent sugar dehydrogenase [Flavobacteriales bacterium]
MRKLLFAFLLPVHMAVAQSPVTIQLEQFATGLAGVVDITNAGDDRLFAVLQPGVIRIVDASGMVAPTPFLDIQARVQDSGSEQGLLGLAFDPDHATNGFFYVNYTAGSGNGSTRVSRFSVTADPDVADPNSEQILFTWPQPFSNHNGGDLAFGADGYLYVGFGDGGSANDPQGNAQDLTDPLGDMIRLDVSDPDTTYTIPASNPFAGSMNDTLPEIWASGLRNPWRFSFDALTGDLWIGDVGQNAYEEVDFWPAGNNDHPNFGWRCYEGNTAFNTNGCQPQASYVAPAWVHAQSTQSWCAVTGGYVYRGAEFERLQGRYIYTDYCGGQFYSLHPDGSGGWVREQIYTQSQFGFVCFGENGASELFVGNTENGRIYRIVDTCPMDAPIVTREGNTLTSSEAESYQWYFNGQMIPGATEASYTFAQNGSYYVVATFANGCALASEPTDHIVSSVDEVDVLGIKVFPVPANNELMVSGLPVTVGGLTLVDATGRSVFTHKWTSALGTVIIPTADLSTGTYVLLLLGPDGLTIGQRGVSVQH